MINLETKRAKKAMVLEKRPFETITVPETLTKVKKDLDWFFYQGEADCGVKSNFNALIRALKFSTTHQEESAEDQLVSMIDKQRDFQSIIDSTSKYRKILSKYQKLSSHSKLVLEAFYYEKQYDISVELFFGAGITLIPQTKTFLKLNSTIKEKVTNLDQLKNFILHDRRRMNKIKKEITEMFIDALTEFNSLEDKIYETKERSCNR